MLNSSSKFAAAVTIDVDFSHPATVASVRAAHTPWLSTSLSTRNYTTTQGFLFHTGMHSQSTFYDLQLALYHLSCHGARTRKAALQRSRTVRVHPMAGSEESGKAKSNRLQTGLARHVTRLTEPSIGNKILQKFQVTGPYP